MTSREIFQTLPEINEILSFKVNNELIIPVINYICKFNMQQ